MNKLCALGLLILMSCATKIKSNSSSIMKGAGDSRIKKVEYLDNYTYFLTEISDDKTYGYAESNPIKVGGVKESEGPLNQRRFLDALYGPNDKKMIYWRAGSCCPVQTSAGFNNLGMLDRYGAVEIGSSDTLTLYLNMYDKGDLMIPVGLRAKESKK